MPRNSLTLDDLSARNRLRCESIDGFNHPLTTWTPEQWTNAIAGEAGEACNLAKKYLRWRMGIKGNKEEECPVGLIHGIAEELADVIIYSDLAIQALGFSTERVLKEKFNRKSDEIGSSTKLDSDKRPMRQNRPTRPTTGPMRLAWPQLQALPLWSEGEYIEMIGWLAEKLGYLSNHAARPLPSYHCRNCDNSLTPHVARLFSNKSGECRLFSECVRCGSAADITEILVVDVVDSVSADTPTPNVDESPANPTQPQG